MLLVQNRRNTSVPMNVTSAAGVMTSGFGLCNGHYQSPMLHAFHANQTAGELLHLSRFAMDNEDFKAGIMVKMRMTG